MDRRQIGGGLIALSSVAIPTVATVMGLTIPPTIGYVLLTVFATLTLIGVALAWPKPTPVVPHPAPPADDPARKSDQRSATLSRLTNLYMMSTDGISPAMAAGFQMPPEAWLNEQLEKMGETWRVRNIRGANCETYDV